MFMGRKQTEYVLMNKDEEMIAKVRRRLISSTKLDIIVLHKF